MMARRIAQVGRWIAASVAVACVSACGGAKPGASTVPDDFVAPMPAEPPASPSHRGRSRPAAGRELHIIDELAAVAEHVRELKLKHSVPVMVEDAEAIAGYVEGEIDAAELERARSVYVALGLLDPSLDVKALLVRLMEEQIVGYYDTKQHHLVVRDDVMRAMSRAPREREGVDEAEDASLIEARVVLVHEIVHALQDQHLGLGDAVERKRDTDADNAFRGLIEGDAYLAMLGSSHGSDSLPLSALTQQPEFRSMLASAFREVPFAGEEELSRAPPIVRVPLLSAYLDGLLYAATLHAEGGWPRIDRTHRSPPVSTEQILHPERRDASATPTHVALAGLAALFASAHYEPVQEDTLGELETGVYLAQGTREDRARDAAEGWGGDRLYAFRGKEPVTSVVWLTSWDSAHDADEAEHAARRIHDALPSNTKAQALVERRGLSILIARAVPPNLHTQLLALFAQTPPRAR